MDLGGHVLSGLETWGLMVGISLAVTIFTYWGLCGLVHHHFYVRRRHQAADWKLQPSRFLTPAQNRRALRMGTRNMLIGGTVGGSFAAYVALGGWSSLALSWSSLPVWWHPVSAVLLFFGFDAGLYYSHRLMHQRWIFRHVHARHHRFVAPTVFTVTATHPGEFLVFQSTLLLWAFVLPMHWTVYVGVVLYTYFIGALDHVGARVSWPLPLHGSNAFHNDHHRYFHSNYGHHTALWDRLHGTVHRPGRHYDETTFGDRGAPLPEPAVDLSA